MSALPDLPRVEVASEGALWDWLARHHATDGALLVTWKAAHQEKYVSREAVLDALVAYGWIDGRRYTVDEARTAQLITPRRVQHWAQSYKDRAARLEAEGRMQPPGAASVASGKASGLWDFMADVDRLEVPEDLAAALGSAREAWDALAPSYRRNVLRWVKLAKTDATRAKRIALAAKATREGRKLEQM
ncbi:MAG: YdeI/OmpD-associated family protein [Pseudomonadota bacterium]